MKKYVGLLVLLVAVFAAGCGSGGGASGTPALVTVIDANNNNLITTTTGIFPTAFVASFDHEMSLTSAQVAGAITLTCGTLPTAGLSVAQGGSNNDLVITITDPWKYALMNCTLTFTTAITSLGGQPMAANASYVFTNACAVSDDFNAQTVQDGGGCWNVYANSPFETVLWSSLAAWLNIDTSTSSLNANFTGADTQVSLQKVAGTGSGAFEIEIKIENPSGITHSPAGWPSVFAAILGDNATLRSIVNEIVIGIAASGGQMYCAITAFTLPNTPVSSYGTLCDDPTETYYIKYSTLSGTPTFKYKMEGDADYTVLDLSPGSGPWPTGAAWEFAGTGNSSLEIFFNAYGGEMGNIGHIKTQGITVTDQYVSEVQ